jgi:hypothetical protein
MGVNLRRIAPPKKSALWSGKAFNAALANCLNRHAIALAGDEPILVKKAVTW